MRPRFLLLASLFVAGALSVAAQSSANLKPAPLTSDEERLALHQSDEWLSLQAHLPDPGLATPADLEMAGDVLRARRFPEDALDYYGYALARGGKVSSLLNKMGVVRLELRQNSLAHELFLRVVHEQKKNATAWNNLGVTEFMAGNYRTAVYDYKKAAAMEKGFATFHTNLGMAYFKMGDVESARAQFVIAMTIDPHVMQSHDVGGDSMHVVESLDYPKLCFELARLAAKQQRYDEFHLWLARAGDGGFNIKEAMENDMALVTFLKDPKVQTILTNEKELSRRNVATVKGMPSLGAARQNPN